MNRIVVFGDVVVKICQARPPTMTKSPLSGPASEPVEFHIYGFEAFACKVVGHNAKCSRVVGLHGRGRLFMSYFFEGMTRWDCFSAVDEERAKFGVCG